MSHSVRKPRMMRGFPQGEKVLANIQSRILPATPNRRWVVLGSYALLLLVLLPGAIALQAIPRPIAVSSTSLIRLEAIILREFPGSHLLIVEPMVYDKVPAYTITLRTPRGSVWRTEIGLNRVQLGLSRLVRPSTLSPTSFSTAKIRALSSVGGGHIVSYRTQGQYWIFTIMVETEQSFLVTINRHTGQIRSVKDS